MTTQENPEKWTAARTCAGASEGGLPAAADVLDDLVKALQEA